LESIVPLPHPGSRGEITFPLAFSKLLRSAGHDGRGSTWQSCPSQRVSHRPKATHDRPLQIDSCGGGIPPAVFASVLRAANMITIAASAMDTVTPRPAAISMLSFIFRLLVGFRVSVTVSTCPV
jgi:hypothetical protein